MSSSMLNLLKTEDEAKARTNKLPFHTEASWHYSRPSFFVPMLRVEGMAKCKLELLKC